LVPKELFNKGGNYLGRPADFEDELVLRRIRLLQKIPGFLAKEYSLLDIGCGNGASMFLLSKSMKKCVGIDINNDHGADFKSYMTEHSITNCELRVLDVVSNKAKKKFANARIYTKTRIRKLLESHGFEVLSFQYITTPLDHFPDGKIKDWLLKNVFTTITTKFPLTKSPCNICCCQETKE